MEISAITSVALGFLHSLCGNVALDAKLLGQSAASQLLRSLKTSQSMTSVNLNHATISTIWRHDDE